MTYLAAEDRYDDKMRPYRRVGRSGLQAARGVPPGQWQELRRRGRRIDVQRAVLRRAFDLGVTHFEALAKQLRAAVRRTRGSTSGGWCARTSGRTGNELVISTKAGYDKWPGSYGDHGLAQVPLLASLDQSLKRMGLEYVDIFYSHRFDPDTPLEETMGALDTAVRSGRALYAGISSYSPERTREAYEILRSLGHAAADPPAVLLDGQPVDRGRAARHARRSSASGASRSPRWRRAC